MFIKYYGIIDSYTIATIAASVNRYLREYRAKQKHLLPFHVTNYALKQVLY